jgi:hypothetical protein
MPRFGRDGKRIVQCTPEPGPLRELPRPIDGLTVSFLELNKKRDRLEGDVDKFRRRLAEAEGELDQLQRSWSPSLLDTKQRLEQYRDKLRVHLGAVSSELDATKASIPEARAALVRHYAVAQASWRPVEALTVPCPACGQPSVPHRTAAAGRGWRKGWYECPPTTVIPPGRPGGQVGHTPRSGWPVCESSTHGQAGGLRRRLGVGRTVTGLAVR